MSNPRDLAKTALQNSRTQRQQQTERTQAASDRRNQFSATYAGYANGSHLAQLPNGAKVPVKWQSTGGLDRGQPLIISVPHKSATAYARVMPRG